MTEIVNETPTTDVFETPETSELSLLKSRADLMGLRYHPSISLEKLKEKMQAALAPQEKTEPNSIPTAEVETLAERQIRKRKEAHQLVRIKISCMNPAKKEWEGETFTGGNSLIGSITKFVPFNAEEAYHVPQIILNIIQARKCQVFVTKKDSKGRSVKTGRQIKEFAIEILPPLTLEELKALASRQVASLSGESQ